MNKSLSHEVESHLPLREATFFILLSLAAGAHHGYAILKEVSELSAGRVVLSTGTLYGALKRLLEQGWIERVAAPVQQDNATERAGPPRKAYRLTDLGHLILDAEADRLHALLKMVRTQMSGSQR